jgi:ADP-ribose pyrophosphatase
LTRRHHPFTTLSQRTLWESRWFSLRRDQIRLPDGRELDYHFIDKPPAVWIVPVLADGRLVLIEEYRYAVGDWVLEVPAGTSEPGEDAAATALRELREEIGGTAARLVSIGEYYVAVGISNGIAKVFLALGVTLGDAHPEDAEDITLRPVPAREALRMARAGEIKAGSSALAILLSEAAICEYLRGLDL